MELPAFEPITPERIEALVETLVRTSKAEEKNRWYLTHEAKRMLEDEQERIVRIHEAHGKRKPTTPDQQPREEA